MITRRSYPALSSVERQFLRSGRCARCFHAARRQQAEEHRPEDGSPASKDSAKRAENNGPQIRSKPSKRERASIISNEVSMLQRGPPAPPPGDPTSGPATRKVDEVQEPAEGGLSVREASKSVTLETDAGGAMKGEAQLRSKLADTRPQGLPVRPNPSALSPENVLLNGRGSGIPSTTYPMATIHDRFKVATNPASNKGRGQQTLSSKGARTLAKVLIGGEYDNKGLLRGEKVYDDERLNQIKRKTMINGTYLGSDGDRLVKRVEGLLAASRAVPARKKVAPVKKA